MKKRIVTFHVAHAPYGDQPFEQSAVEDEDGVLTPVATVDWGDVATEEITEDQYKALVVKRDEDAAKLRAQMEKDAKLARDAEIKVWAAIFDKLVKLGFTNQEASLMTGISGGTIVAKVKIA